jgi:hypothetical protein
LTRLYRVLDLVNRLLGEFNPVIRVVEHYVGVEEDIEYLNIRIRFRQIGALVPIHEYWQGGNLTAYGYYVRVRGYEEWWDNRPHHPEIPKYPHHKHAGKRCTRFKTPR